MDSNVVHVSEAFMLFLTVRKTANKEKQNTMRAIGQNSQWKVVTDRENTFNPIGQTKYAANFKPIINSFQRSPEKRSTAMFQVNILIYLGYFCNRRSYLHARNALVYLKKIEGNIENLKKEEAN